MELNEVEKMAYAQKRNFINKSQAKNAQFIREGTNYRENRFGNKYAQIEQEYTMIYRDYFYNLLLNLITYENAPTTFDEKFCEYLLRTTGYCRVAGTDPLNVYVVDYYDKPIQTPTIGGIGWVYDTDTNQQVKKLDGTDKNLRQITRINFMDVMEKNSEGYVMLTNKYNGYMPMLSNWNDFKLADRVAKTLATIKATQTYNLLQMKTPYVTYGTKGDLTGKNLYEELVEGIPLIEVEESVGDVKQRIGTIDLNIPNYLPSLKDAFNCEFDEFLTMVGINSVGIDKKERLVANEANSNAQLIEASANIYLDARNSQLELLNAVLGTDIKAVLNQESAKQLLQLRQEVNRSLEPEDTMEASPQSI